MKYIAMFFCSISILSCNAQDNKLHSELYSLSEKGLDKSLGKITVSDYNKGKGIIISISATDLIPGYHGFHVHETNTLTPSTNADGSLVVGGMAGGHWDPDKTGKHEGPEGQGHRGDLPQILVQPDGSINMVLTNTRILLNDMKGKSLMIHANPDNYSDHPSPLGGSGARFYAAPF